jgi:hypothetical protein
MRGGKKRALRILMAISSLSVLAALGCGTYSPVAPSNDTLLMPGVENPSFAMLLSASKESDAIMRSSVASGVISADKGGVVSNGYFSLSFAPGAVEKDTEISIEMPEFPKAMVRLGPHGIQFKAEVILSLPLSVVASADGEHNIVWHNEAIGLWENIGSYMDGDCVKAKLEHFSEYGDGNIEKTKPTSP